MVSLAPTRINLSRVRHILTERQHKLLDLLIWTEEHRDSFVATRKWMADRMGCSVQTLKRALAKLEWVFRTGNEPFQLRVPCYGEPMVPGRPETTRHPNSHRIVAFVAALVAFVSRQRSVPFFSQKTVGRLHISTTERSKPAPLDTPACPPSSRGAPIDLDLLLSMSEDQRVETNVALMRSIGVWPRPAARYAVLNVDFQRCCDEVRQILNRSNHRSDHTKKRTSPTSIIARIIYREMRNAHSQWRSWRKNGFALK